MSTFRRDVFASRKNDDDDDDDGGSSSGGGDVVVVGSAPNEKNNYCFEAYLVENDNRNDRETIDGDEAETTTTTTTTKERLVIRHSLSTTGTIPSSPREWMERRGIEGAYTVVRCELTTRDRTTTSSSSRWTVWGYPFHDDRLRSSYRDVDVVASNDRHDDDTTTDDDDSRRHLDAASAESRSIVDALLTAYEERASLGRRSDDDERAEVREDDDDDRHVAMLTLLWTPSSKSTDGGSSRHSAIDVRGHVCRSTVSSSSPQPSPVTVTLALDRHNSNDGSSDDDVVVVSHRRRPNRYGHHPASKLSSWCWRRRPLEEDFSLVGRKERAGEIILLRRRQSGGDGNDDDDDDWEVLEGLTSNVFFVYDDGRIGTARRGSVLGGYARRLVLDHLKRRRRDDGDGEGLSSLERSETEDEKEEEEKGVILLKDAARWKEIFLTSAMKLVVPVDKVLMVVENDDDDRGGNGDDCEMKWKEIWSATARDEDATTPRRWQIIRDDILKHGGDDWVL